MARRLIVVAVETDGSLELDYDGDWAAWEAAAALEEAARIIREDATAEQD